MEKERKNNISRLLSLVLRHKPETIGVTLDNNGWADVSILIEKLQKKEDGFSFEDLLEIVETNDKKRFAFNEDESKIRANQGHSISSIDLELKPIVPPFKLYHGTDEQFVESILKIGLKKMNRQHVHMYDESKLEIATKSGGRRKKCKKTIIIEIESKQMYNDGFKFYKSDNDVYLTDLVPVKYIRIKE